MLTKLKQAEQIISKATSRHRQPFNRDEYRKLLAGLRPHSNAEFRAKAFEIVREKEIFLRPEEKDDRRRPL
jgi:hypothetical protein